MEWDLKEQAPRDFLEKFSRHDNLTKTLLWQRGLQTESDIKSFFDFNYKSALHSPWLLKNMDKAVERILAAWRNKEKVVVWGDYDVDGVSSSAILTEIFGKIGLDFHVHIPDRNEDGYGLNLDGVNEVAASGAKLIITVDCGMSDFSEIERASSLGLEVIVIDHHLVLGKLPEPAIIVNPWQEGDEYPFKNLAATGVVFKVACALIEKLMESGFSEEFPSGYEKNFLDLVALATVADAEPLLGENRALVKFGLVVLATTRRVGLKVLMASARVKPSVNLKTFETNLSAYTLGYVLAPRINAASRMAHANISFRLLVTEDIVEAKSLAEKLEQRNKERQKLVGKILKEINGRVDVGHLPPAIILGSAGWSIGVLGLVAGKLTEKFFVPSFLYEIKEEKVIGSARGLNNFNLLDALNDCRQHLGEYGGHKQAAGFRLEAQNLDKFEGCLNESSAKFFNEKQNPVLRVDIEASAGDIDLGLIEKLNKFEPFGPGNPTPKILIRKLEVLDSRLVGRGAKHLKMKLKDGEGGKILDAICFGRGVIEESHQKGERVDVVAEILPDEYNGYLKVSLKVLDLRPA